MHYYLIHSRDSWEQGQAVSAHLEEQGITFSQGSYAAFLSGGIDAHTEAMAWYELYLQGTTVDLVHGRVSVYASDRAAWETAGKPPRDLFSFLRDDTISLEEKKAEMAGFLQKTAELRPRTELLSVKGRYLWFLLELYDLPQDVFLNAAYLYFDVKNWAGYLPEVYRGSEGTFLPRYLGMLQSIYERMNLDISGKDAYFAVQTTDRAFLELLADWIKLDRVWLADQEALRRMLRQAHYFYRKRGTKEALVRAVELYLQEPVYLLEYQDMYENDVRKRADAAGLWEDMDAFTCVLVIQPAAALDKERVDAVYQIAESMVPAQIRVKVVVLQEGIHLGGANYLGMNTTIGQYGPLRLDGSAAVSFIRLEEEREQQ